MTSPVRPPIAPMLAKLARALPEGDWLYEPKWDGFRTIAFVEDGDVDLRSRNDKPLARYFPEVTDALRELPVVSAVLDGEIVVAREGTLDFAALMGRLHPSASRVARLSKQTPAAFIAFDVLALEDEDLRGTPFFTRRARLEAVLGSAPSPALLVTPQVRERALAASWLERFNGGGIDGVVAKSPQLPYTAGKRTMVKVKHERTLDCVVAGLRLSSIGPAVGSLLLGIYGDDGRLVHVGVASQLTDAARRDLARELRSLVTPLAGHPWERGFGLERSPLGRLAGSAGRWSPDEMEQDWIPLRPERVCEVVYTTIDDRRLRFPARFMRWRPDRDPRSCRFDQIASSTLDLRALMQRGAAP